MKATRFVAVLLTLGGLYWPASGYEPVLPKVGKTERIIVVDVAKDVQNDDAPDVLLAITCLQGLVNRQSTEKIYLVNFPWRLNWDWNKQERFGSVHPAQAVIDDGLLPFPTDTAKLDPNKRYPALSYLVRRYKDVPKGKVLCPAAGKASSGARAAAVNVCTFEGAIALTERLDAYLREEGVNLPLLADTRSMDELAAFDWSVARYMSHPQRNKQLLGFQGDIGSNTPIMVDYFVATGTFCYFLDTETINDPEPEDAKFDVLADVRHYPPGVPHIGPVEGAHVIQRIQKRGHLPVCGFVANGSVTSSVPTDSQAFRPAESKAHPIENDALYLAWEIHDDGDALDVNSLVMYGALRIDPALGTFPAGVRVNPYLIDLNPALFAWFASRPQTQVVASLTDGGASYTPEGQMAWVTTYRRYRAFSNGALQILNFFGPAKKKFIEALDFPCDGERGLPSFHSPG
ncbi:MAG: hypothetical protein H5U08_02735 [Thermogutta sp.]|uniref:GxGYxYP domain-containing protein n=1 Tax=Thermogutta sp. TaxID=1962930 RepID=UPI0019BD76F4|nr:GxGYxYP domain-containing protein [Thermogutta sp.]MBC7351249.1 hypothetical protein [Thermogutta sp.]